MARIGLISDTHGLLLAGGCFIPAGDATHIVHGGDIGHAEILAQLSALAAGDGRPREQ